MPCIPESELIMPDAGHREFRILTEHEVARSLTAIEEVGRSGKPVAEIGQRHVGPGRLEELREDLERCLEMAAEEGVRGFIRKIGSKRVTYGFFKQAWVLAAPTAAVRIIDPGSPPGQS